jgi:hypothetical protein
VTQFAVPRGLMRFLRSLRRNNIALLRRQALACTRSFADGAFSMADLLYLGIILASFAALVIGTYLSEHL